MKFGLPAVRRSAELRTWIIFSVLASPSLFLLFTCPPLWRDTDGFNQIASTFAPQGIIHWLPGYCFFGRLIMIIGGVAGSVLTGHGIPYLSIGTPTLNDAGIYTLIVFQHAFLIASLWYLIQALSDRFWLKLLFAGFLVLTPWLYLFAHCIGSEAFSNPLVILTLAAGWKCLKLPSPSRQPVGVFFLFLLSALLTRQINGVLVVALPLALFILTGIYRLQPFARTPISPTKPWRSRNANLSGDSSAGASAKEEALAKSEHHPLSWQLFARKFALFLGLGMLALVGSIAIQMAMCWVFRVPYRTTFGRTFEWRLRYLASLSADDRTRLFDRVSTQLKDPMLTSALTALNHALVRDPDWKELFLFQNLDAQFESAGVTNWQIRAYNADLKLNRLARHFILPPEPDYLHAVWTDFSRAPFVSQPDLSRSPFETTTGLQSELGSPRYARLRSLATFQYNPSFFTHIRERIPYFNVLVGIPMMFIAGAAIFFAASAWVLGRRNGETVAATAYIGTLIGLGFLFALGNCASTNFDVRYFMPVYSCFQIALMLAVSILVRRCR